MNELLNNPTVYSGFEDKNFEPNSLNDLSRSLVNSIMLKKKMQSIKSENSKHINTNNSSEKMHVLQRFNDAMLQPI